MDYRPLSADDPGNRGEVLLAAWATGAVLSLLVLAAYLLEPPLTLARSGEVAGTMAFVFMVFALLLTLRLPAVANAFGGLETLYSLHRGFGIAAYGMMLLHPLLLAQQGGWRVLQLDGKDLWFRLGWSGLLMVMVGLVCTFVLKTRGYDSWRRLHLLLVPAYLAIVLHCAAYQGDWPLLGRLLFNGLLLAGILAPVLRHLLIDRGIGARAYRVETVGYPAKEVIDMRLTPLGKALTVSPGQFVFARFAPAGAYPGCGHFHPFTASRVMDDGTLRLSIKASGHCTRLMQRIEAGSTARIQGPYGNLFQHARTDGQVWIAGGIGITPFVARLRALDENHSPIQLLYFYDRPAEAAYLDEIANLAQGRQRFSFHPIPIFGRGETIESTFDALLPPWDDKQYVLCGPPSFADYVRQYLRDHGVADQAMHQERMEFR